MAGFLALAVIVVLVAVVVYDLLQRQHAILRTFPVVGHFRYWLEAVGPELRQWRNGVTPTTARPVWRRSTRGSCAVWIRR
jgi:hypothetical protein